MSFGQKSGGQMSWLKVDCSPPFTRLNLPSTQLAVTLLVLLLQPTDITKTCQLTDVLPIF